MERESGKKTDQKDILIVMSSEKDRKGMWQPELERLLISLRLIGLTRSHVLQMNGGQLSNPELALAGLE